MNIVQLLGEKLQNNQAKDEMKLKERRKKRSLKDANLLLFIFSLFVLVVFLTLHTLDAKAVNSTIKSEDSVPVSKVEKEPVIENHVQVAQVMAVSTKVVKQEEPKEEPSIYNPDIPMPKEHQEYLYKLCEEKGLDYKQTLAVIQHESVFDPNATNVTNDFGYFQINQINHTTLASKLQTANDPFDPYVNMQWGTYMLADLYQYWADKGYKGQSLTDAVWSSYNRGKTGFLRNGHAVEYVSKMKASVEQINNLF